MWGLNPRPLPCQGRFHIVINTGKANCVLKTDVLNVSSQILRSLLSYEGGNDSLETMRDSGKVGSMTITVQIPDRIATQLRLESGESRSRQFLEAFVLQRFAEGELTTAQVGEAMGLSFHQAERFLHDHHAPPHVTAEEHRGDLANLERILGSE